MKARGANWIRYPSSPGSKPCILNIVISSRDCGAEAKAEVCYLGSIVARSKLKGIGGGALQRVIACGLIRFYTVNLTRIDCRMKVSLKGLPNTLRGGAWPSSACVVR